jgi:iron/manganese superoxide dismutase-like protein
MAASHAAIALPELPYAHDALEPHMSRETLDYHYGKHHKAYVDKVNSLIVGTEFEDASLEELVEESSGTLFNNAAQVWNHDFFWNCLSPRRQQPGRQLARALESLGGLQSLQTQFDKAASNLFGSGWTWLIKGARRRAEDRHQLQRQYARPRGPDSAAHVRHVGARLLHRSSQRSGRVPEGLLAAGELGVRRGESRLARGPLTDCWRASGHSRLRS